MSEQNKNCELNTNFSYFYREVNCFCDMVLDFFGYKLKLIL